MEDPVLIRVGAFGMIFAPNNFITEFSGPMTRVVFAADCGGIAQKVIRHLSR
jgi:hypothetical protein